MSALELLDPGFVARLEALRRRLVVRASAGLGGERSSRRRGASADFAEHRPYSPGDDLRRIDWAAFARSGEPVLKLFRAEEDALVRLAVDTSASLEGPKLDHAVRLAAALGYLALAAGERVQLVPFADAPAEGPAPSRGRRAVPALFQALSELTARGATDLSRGLEPALSARRPGLLLVLSDFLDRAGFEGPLRRACAAGHEVALVQVLAPEELDPALEGDLVLEDSETGDAVELTLDARALAAYRARLGALFAALRGFARTHRAGYVRALTDRPLEDAVLRVLDHAVEEPWT
ncbi:MAG: DUF58 domain-containing protein [Deltaproteobacteria bacterium]|nr:DUF58 domain-containing protein [Deltaproteobacteria bacterium]